MYLMKLMNICVRFSTQFSLFKENAVPVFYRARTKRLSVSFTRLNANLGRVSRPEGILV